MGKEYFSHDCNTRNKKKMATLLHKEKLQGYGLFWIIVEMLHEDSTNWMDLSESTYIAIAKEAGSKVDFVEKFILRCIEEHRVFIVDSEGRFTTERVLVNMAKREEISEKRSLAGKASAEARQKLANVVQMSTSAEQMSTIKVKESKVKESKREEQKPSFPEKFHFDLSLDLPPHTREAVEMNQVTHTSKKNTDFVKSQWKLFLHERSSDPPERLREFRRLADLTSYFINWMRPKFPNKFNPTETPNHNKLNFREEDDKNMIDQIEKKFAK